MPIPTPFHSRTQALCKSQEWRNWAGWLAAATYETSHEHEYYAIRNAAALIDISPLFKYEIVGPQASSLVDRIITRQASSMAVRQVLYTPWCNDNGKVIDDGTVSRLGIDCFRITAADPNLAWFQDCGYGMDASIEDVSEQLAGLALQGPNAKAILQKSITGVDLDSIAYYHLAQAQVEDFPVTVSRTGYTGDLGYELWVEPEFAIRLWDTLMDNGIPFGVLPVGIVALDIARIEAGLLLIDVDYISARKALIPSQTSSPFEIGLGWTVDLKKASFVGRDILAVEQQRGAAQKLVGLDIHWNSLEDLFAAVDLVPQVAGRASRAPVPLYHKGQQIGQATSHTFSPILKRYLALGTINTEYASPGTKVEFEVTVEYRRLKASATVTRPRFFDPPRKRA